MKRFVRDVVDQLADPAGRTRMPDPVPIDWPARFRAAAEVAAGAGWNGTAANIRDLAHRHADEDRRRVVEAIGRALLGEPS